MTLRHLECALTVAGAGSINNAAKKMLVSQPYLSGMINSLENELGYTIFERSSQGIVCTPEGLLFIEHAEKIMSELEKIRSISSDSDKPIRIATYYSRFITQRFLEFHSKTANPPADRYSEMGNMEIIEAVARREYSLGIIYNAVTKNEKFLTLAEKNNLEYSPLFEKMGTYIIMGPSHPLAHKDRISAEEFRKAPMVFFDDPSTVLYLIDHLKLPMSAADVSVSGRGAFTDALLSGQYISIINTPFPEDEKMFILKDIHECLPENADIEVNSGYLKRRDHKLTTREKEFLDSLI